MAKSTGGLMGRADASLVAASFKEAMANVPADLKDVYDKNEEAFKTFSEGLTSFYEELTREEREANQKTKDTTESLNASGKALNNTAILGEVQNAANYYSDQVKGTKDPLERSKAEMKMEDLTTKLNSAQQNLATLLETPGLEMDDDTRRFYNAILSDLENDTNETKVKFDPEKNDFVFSDPTSPDVDAAKQMTMKELFNNIGAKQPEATTGINEHITGMTAGKNVYKNENDFNGRIESFISSGMETKKDIIARYNDKEINGMDGYSVKNLLSGAVPNNFENPLSKDLYGVLGTLDVNKDGSIGDEKDRSFATPANFAILKRNIEENPDLLKQVISKTIGAVSGGNSYNTMLRLNKPKSSGSGSGSGGLAGTQGERQAVAQVENFGKALQGNKSTSFQISLDNGIEIDPVNKTIKEFYMDENNERQEQEIGAQRAIDLLIKKAGVFNAQELFGDLLNDYNKTPLPVLENKEKKDKPGTIISRLLYPSKYFKFKD